MALTKEEVNAFVRLDIDPGTITWQRGTRDIKENTSKETFAVAAETVFPGKMGKRAQLVTPSLSLVG